MHVDICKTLYIYTYLHINVVLYTHTYIHLCVLKPNSKPAAGCLCPPSTSSIKDSFNCVFNPLPEPPASAALPLSRCGAEPPSCPRQAGSWRRTPEGYTLPPEQPTGTLPGEARGAGNPSTGYRVLLFPWKAEPGEAGFCHSQRSPPAPG